MIRGSTIPGSTASGFMNVIGDWLTLTAFLLRSLFMTDDVDDAAGTAAIV
jgi:hypothetical protein